MISQEIKTTLTKSVLTTLNSAFTEKDFQNCLKSWWVNPRKKVTGGLRLTLLGYQCLTSAGVKVHQISFEIPIVVTNQLLVRLDRHIDCPFYLTNYEIFVFGERMAIELVLFSGNITRFLQIKANNVALDKTLK